MKFFSKVTFLMVFLSINQVLIGQSVYENGLIDALKKAKKENKNLIIYRYDSTLVSYYKSYNYPALYHSLDSIFRLPNISKNLAAEFLLFSIEAHSKNNIEQDFYNNYFYESTPNLIIFSPDNFTLSYLNTESLNSDFIPNMLLVFNNSIKENHEKVVRRNELEAKYNKKIISSDELLELIRIRSTFGLKSTSHLNEFALKKGKINDDYQVFFIKQNLKTSDPFVDYFLNYTNENNLFLSSKLALINDILKTAKRNKDKIELENSLNLQLEYTKKIYQNTSVLGQSKDSVKYLDELIDKQTLTRFDYYISISDTSKIIENSTKLCESIIDNYKKKQEEFLKFHINLSFDSTFFLNHDEWIIKNNEYKKKIALELDAYKADLLNTAAWNFYLYSKDATDLKNALKWSEFSLKLNSTPEKIDTYAHLLFSLGETKEAINFQKKAIEGAENDELYKGLPAKMKLELSRFQIK